MIIECCITIMHVVPELAWQLCWLGGLGLVAGALFFVRKKVKLLVMGVGCGITLFAGFFLACYAHTQHCCWICPMQQMPLYVGPSFQYHQLHEIASGELVRVRKRYGAWCDVQTKACRGWAHLV